MPISRSRKRKIRRRVPVRRLNPLALDRMFDSLVNDAFAPKPPAVLYHYTKMESAANILRSQRFWATAHDCTNDVAELTSADAVIVDVAKELRGTHTGVVAAVLDLFIEGFIKNLHVTKVVPVYLACFSAARDDREQWRNYADEGRGVCLGIRRLTEPPPDNPNLGCALIQVDYSEESWRKKVRENFIKVCSLLSRAEATRPNIELGLSALHRIAAFASIAAKRPEWAVEQEYRYVVLDREASVVTPQLGASGKRYLPVLVRHSGRLIALAEVIVGSNQESDGAVAQVKQFLADAGYAPDQSEYPQEIVVSAVLRSDCGEARALIPASRGEDSLRTGNLS